MTSVVVKYKTQKDYCSCCDQELPNPKVSNGEFEISKEDVLSWTDWEHYIEYPEDLDGVVSQFVYEVISFHSVGSYERIIVDESEEKRVEEFILQVATAANQ